MLFVFSTCLVLTAAIFGQTGYTDNKSDQTLRGSGRVNPSTLGMEFSLPLGSYPGRGINVPISLSYSSKLWNIEYSGTTEGTRGSERCQSKNTAKFAENSAAGWTTSLEVPYIEYTGRDNIYNDQGFPDTFNECEESPSNVNYYAYVRRLTVHLPSGETHELRADDTVTYYSPQSSCPPRDGYPCDPGSPLLQSNWNRTYFATDGSNIKYFEYANDNIYILQMPDGSFYDFSGSLSNRYLKEVRKAIKFTDRNGNFTAYNAQTGALTDTLGRTLTVPIENSAPNAPVVNTYTLPGMTGSYKFRWKKLKGDSAAESALTDFSRQLRYRGDKLHIVGRGTWEPIPPGTDSLFASESPAFVLAQELFNPVVLAEIETPDGASYKFGYDVYGRIEQIDYPTGGKETFVYNPIAPLSPGEPGNVTDQANFGVTERKIFPDAGQAGNFYSWHYSAEHVAPAGYKVSATQPDGTKSVRFLHMANGSCTGCATGSFGYDNGLAGMPYEELNFSSSGQLVTKKITRWELSGLPVWVQTSPDGGYVLNNGADWHPRVEHEETIVYDSSGSGVSATTAYWYEGNLNLRDTPVLQNKSTQYAFVAMTAGSNLSGGEDPEDLPDPDPTPVPTPNAATLTPVKTVETTYLINDAGIDSAIRETYKSKNQIQLVTASVVKTGSDVVAARSETSYDEQGYSPQVGRGNPTTSRKGVVTNADAYISTSARFDDYGNQTESIDAKGNATTTVYDPAYHAFPVQVTTAAPDPSGQQGSDAGFTTTATFNPTTGLPLSTTDANGLETRIEYDPATLRPKNTKTFYQNAQVGSQSETIYHDEPNNYWVKNRTQIDAQNWAESFTYFDGLGRAYKTEKVDAQGNIFTEKEFDDQGRVKRITNPYRTGEPKKWTTNVYDEAGRVKEVVTADGAKVKTDYGAATTGAQIGASVTVTDQAGKQRRSITDALGQLIRVDEPNDAGQLGTIDAPNQPTYYEYDALSNLTKVKQGGTFTNPQQTRSFVYDSLSRLKSAANPESGLINYSYDANGNLTSKTDARGITTTYAYDALNRVVTRNYSDATPDVAYTYDNLPNAKGKLTKVANGTLGTDGALTNPFSVTEYQQFDEMGRVEKSQQTTGGTAYGEPMEYTYNLSGALVEQKYPSGRVVRNVLDNDGDLALVQSKRNADAGYWNYAKSFTYTAAGAVSSMQLGNSKWESTVFNARLQPTQIALGNVPNATDRLKLNFDYGGADNNGNVKSQTITVPTVGQTAGFTATQTYTYDALNRIKDAKEMIGTNQQWRQTFDYDRYGNRRFDTGTDTVGNKTTTLDANCPTAVCNPTIDPATNKLIGYTFDAAGNTEKDAENRKFTYDAENKQIKVETIDANGTVTGTLGFYFYDGDGKRVKKISFENNQWMTTIFVYDASGKMVAEYSTQVEPAATAKVSYLTNDHLGSPRITTDANGQVISRRDFMPFGEEIARAGYGTDEVRQKFTSYERDTETDLDFAQARMYANKLGRFTSPDPMLSSGKPFLPASWNRYSYVLNNPLILIDPIGLDFEINGDERQWAFDEFSKGLSFKTTLTDKNKVAIVGKDGKVLDNEKDKKALNKMLKSMKDGPEKELFKAIIDTKNHAVLTANTRDDDVDIGETKGVGKNAVDRGEVEMVAKHEKDGGFSSSDIVRHEAMEAYMTAKTGLPVFVPGGTPGKDFNTDPHFKNPFPGMTSSAPPRSSGNTAFLDATILPGSKAKGSYTIKKEFDKGETKKGRITSVLYFPF